MHPLSEHLQNPLTRQRDELDRQRIAKLFPELSACTETHFLALRHYRDSRPQKFFSASAYQTFLDWLKTRHTTNQDSLKAYFMEHEAEIGRALLFLREINSEDWHDGSLQAGDEYDLIRSIDAHVHPAYLRLVEAVLAPLLRPIAQFSRIDRGKSINGLDVWSIMQEIGGGPAASLIQPYEHIIRNGIAHGGITFLQNEIRYRDKKGNEGTFTSDAVVRLCDDLLDICNGLAVSLKVFFALHRDRGYVSPRQILIEELQEETRTPWWTIEGCAESAITGKSQLIIFARPDSRHYHKVQWSAFQSGILAEYFAPGYGRYFLSLHSPKALPGWAGFDGTKMRELREALVDDLTKYAGVLENGMVFYVTRPAMPRLLGKLDTLCRSLQLSFPVAMQKLRSRLAIPRIDCRNAKAHRNLWGVVIRGEVVIDDLAGDNAVAIVRKHRRRIIRSAVSRARRETRRSIVPYLPLAFAQVAVFRRDYRRRRLSGFGLAEDLICTVRFQRMKRIQSPDILGATIESSGNWRIAWNRAWLTTSGASLD